LTHTRATHNLRWVATEVAKKHNPFF
jgi:hypothetical protein